MATITGTAGNDVLQGTADADTITGLAGNDVLIGEAGADSLDGGTGADTMVGGDGSDTYFVDDSGDVVSESTTATDGTAIDAGGTADLVNTSVSFALGAFIENLTASGSAGISLTGNNVANVITGNSGANAIFGGVDSTGAAADTLIGGGGNDTYTIRDGANDFIVEAADNAVAGTVGGSDTVLVVASANRTSYDLSTSGTGFAAGALTGVGASSVETIIASDGSSTLALDLRGSSTAQTIVGNAGINRLDGFGGADTLIGLGGDDTYVVRGTGTVVVEDANGGADTAIITGTTPAAGTATFTIAGAVETITANGVAAGVAGGFNGEAVAAYAGDVNITGGTTSQSITGNASANALIGGGGADTLIGLAGNDTYTVDSLDDVVNETITGSGGIDRVIALNSYAIGGGTAGAASGIEVLTAGGTNLATLTGQGDSTNDLNALNTTVTSNYFVGDTGQSQAIFGDAGGNILNGRTGDGAGGVADTLYGGNGSDTYRVYGQTDVVVEDANGGAFDFVLTSSDYSLVQNDINARAATFSTGGADPVTRTVGTSFLGATAASQIEVLSAADQAGGTVGVASINLIGNAAGQIIIGDFGNNQITDNGALADGTTPTATGQDQLAGLRGDDTYFVTAQSTTVNENVGEGTDTVNVTLGAGGFFGLIDAAEVEFVNAGGAAAFNLSGNRFNQVITGNGAANTLDGRGGQDTLVGGAGNDTYFITTAQGASITTIIEAEATTGGTADAVSTSVSFDLAATNASYVPSNGGSATTAGGIIGIEQIYVTNAMSTDNINLTGNGAAQIIVGNYGNNILDGDNDTRAGGANTALTGTATGDTLTGLLGNDTYRVYSQNDVVRENVGEGTDTVFTSGNYQLRAGTSIEVLAAANQASTAALQLIGNELNQTVSGTAGNDTIWGLAGNDTLIGGLGSDTFGFNETGAGNADLLQDFTAGDFIGLSTSAFAAVGGSLDSTEFVVGTAAQDANDYIVYNQTTGQLFYDADGNGAGAAVLFATLAAGTTLGFNDFAVIAPPPATPVAA